MAYSRLLSVIYPVLDRPEIIDSLLSLRSAVTDLKIETEVIVVDGSRSSLLLKDFSTYYFNIRYIDVSQTNFNFNKSKYINIGIKSSSGVYILISDSDILWNMPTLEKLLNSCNCRLSLGYVQKVLESKAELNVPSGLRYTFYLGNNRRLNKYVLIKKDNRRTMWRPGYGLVLFRHECVDLIHGLHEDFEGWGWEDCDLIIRAWLNGIDVKSVGEVVHVSHINLKEDLSNKIKSRNKNIKISFSVLSSLFPSRIKLSKSVQRAIF
ncbi:MAG TPA: glycosyltransferase family 2 protein [Candidatus Wunengus sp. YC60]|uniref:glycosyltransferase family 2 protein n=1 Tax=Candidatus Wunengus sp. YC60 TaxID=3367697 RepID=UPI0040252566